MSVARRRASSGLTAVLMGVGALVQAAPSAQADDIIPCGTYHNAGDGLVYWGNCTSQDTQISVSQPGTQTQIQCVPAKSAALLGAPSQWIVSDLHRDC
jgi:NAD(P)H-hydrate repair Nnr-like enzyme with NAD(P)H-hydrate epimerase domain